MRRPHLYRVSSSGWELAAKLTVHLWWVVIFEWADTVHPFVLEAFLVFPVFPPFGATCECAPPSNFCVCSPGAVVCESLISSCMLSLYAGDDKADVI